MFGAVPLVRPLRGTGLPCSDFAVGIRPDIPSLQFFRSGPPLYQGRGVRLVVIPVVGVDEFPCGSTLGLVLV